MRKFANMIKDKKDPEEVRNTFNIEDDLTSAEKEQIKKDNDGSELCEGK